LGIISTEMMKQWLGFYPGLFNTAIILKWFLNNRNLNDGYTGGLSSYCMLILIISSLK
jgi:DNA polymerase sigma